MSKDKLFTGQNAIGVCFGVILFLFTAWAFNLYFAWESLAVAIGAVIGMETGFWIGTYKATLNIHKKTFHYSERLISAHAVCLFMYLIMIIAACVSIWLIYTITNKLTPFYTEILFNLPFPEKELQILSKIAMIASGVMLICCPAFLENKNISLPTEYLKYMSFEEAFEKLKFSGLMVSIGALLGVCFFPLSLLVFSIIVLFVIILILIIVTNLLFTLILLAGKKQSFAIAVGVIVGGFTGLLYSGWTKLAFMPSILATLVGIIAGLISAYIASKIAHTKLAKNIFTMTGAGVIIE